jgi:hypothetical protein
VLVSPHYYGYDLTLLLLPMLLAVTGRLGSDGDDVRRHRLLAGMIWGLAGVSPALARLTGINLVPLLLAVWLLLLCRTIRRH